MRDHCILFLTLAMITPSGEQNLPFIVFNENSVPKKQKMVGPTLARLSSVRNTCFAMSSANEPFANKCPTITCSDTFKIKGGSVPYHSSSIFKHHNSQLLPFLKDFHKLLTMVQQSVLLGLRGFVTGSLYTVHFSEYQHCGISSCRTLRISLRIFKFLDCLSAF